MQVRKGRQRWLGQRLGYFLSDRSTVHGIPLRHMILETEQREACTAKISAAMDLIRNRQPYRYSRIRRDVGRIWVWGTIGFAGQWIDELRLCQLNEQYVLSLHTSTEDLAATIIHEATHARLRRCGIGYDEPIRGRVERLCAKAEIQFAKCLPNGALLHGSELSPDSLFPRENHPTR